MNLLQKLRARPALLAVVATIGLVGMGFLLGRLHPRVTTETVRIEDTQSKTKLEQALAVQATLREQLLVAQQTITELKLKKTVVTHEVKTPDGTVTKDTTVTIDKDVKTDSSTHTTKTADSSTTTTSTSTSTSDSSTHTATRTTVTPVRDDWYLGVTAAVNLRDIANTGGSWSIGPVIPGVEAKRRVLGPFWFGAGLDTSLQLKASIGFTF